MAVSMSSTWMKLEGTKTDFLHGCCPLVVAFYEGLLWPTLDRPDRNESILAKWLALSSAVRLLSHTPDFLPNKSLQNSPSLGQPGRSYAGTSLNRKNNTGHVNNMQQISFDVESALAHQEGARIALQRLMFEIPKKEGYIRGITDTISIQIKEHAALTPPRRSAAVRVASQLPVFSESACPATELDRPA